MKMYFIGPHHRNTSRHRLEEHDVLSFIRYNRKLLNAGVMKEDRIEKFNELLELMERYRRKNQYE